VEGPAHREERQHRHQLLHPAGAGRRARAVRRAYAPGGALPQAQEYYADIKKRATSYGRDPEHIKIFMHGSPVVAATDEAARRREREIFAEDDDFDRNLALLGRSFGAYDFGGHDLDAPFPDVAHLAEKGGRTGAAKIIARAKDENLTLRQVAQSVKEFRPSPFVGAPQTVADILQEWFLAGTFDGINLAFRTDDELTAFVDGVVPILQKRGLFRTEYEAATLRGNLGLPTPPNQHTREPRLTDEQAERGPHPHRAAVSDSRA
jgi:alkanesulfonate monooxygenase SsuD/methylene tetrahydromethanopterin reductase-like flavin-dependent oxidoreductase (luciferase family)